MSRHAVKRRFLAGHSAHDYPELVRRWRAVARRAGLRMRALGSADGFPVYGLQTRRLGAGALYVSAGIHGDEPASPWGLLAWAERRAEVLGRGELLLLPCLNPWGLVENRRANAAGTDLNRIFDSDAEPVGPVRALLQGRTFRLAVCLHEDYDARGIYAYDLNEGGHDPSAHDLVRACATAHMPLDSRARIDGRRASGGVIARRRIDLRRVPGMPEAVYLVRAGHAARSLTFESPSEYDLFERVEAHARFLDAVWRSDSAGRIG